MLFLSERFLRIALSLPTSFLQAELQRCNSTHNVYNSCGYPDFPQLKTAHLVGTLTRAINGRYFPLLRLLTGISLRI